MAKSKEKRRKRQPSPALAPTLPRPPSIPQLGKKPKKARDSDHDPSTDAPDTSVDSLGPWEASYPSAGKDGTSDTETDADLGFATAREDSVSSIATLTAKSDRDQSQNITVCVRIKPAASPKENTWKLNPPLGKIALSDQHALIKSRGGKSEEAYAFTFDSIITPQQTTQDLYQSRIVPIVKATMEGYNGVVFCYGQTGSGKTHTMMGNNEEPGIIHQSVNEIFKHIEADADRQYLLRVASLEIYNETLKDLLAGTSSESLKIREGLKGKIYVDSLVEESVTRPSEIFDALERGEENRHVGTTDWNARSSRSHCVFTITVESSNLSGPRETRISQLVSPRFVPPSVLEDEQNLIDLAGSEKMSTSANADLSERNAEGSHINRSLLALGNVIAKLSAPGPKGHIPYRDSKLTRLLQNSLGGNARVAVVCTIAADPAMAVESISTLKFARNAKLVVTQAQQGTVVDNQSALIVKYQREIELLRNQLGAKNQEIATAQDVEEMQNFKEELGQLKHERSAEQAQIEEMRQDRARLQSELQHINKLLLTSRSVANAQQSDLRSPRKMSENYVGLGTPTKNVSASRSISNQLDAIRYEGSERFAELEEQAQQKGAEIRQLQNELEMQRQKNAELTGNLATSARSKKELEEENNRLRQAMNAKHTLAENETRADTEALQNDLKAKQLELEKLQSKVSATARLLAGVQTARDTAETRLTEAESSIASLTSALQQTQQVEIDNQAQIRMAEAAKISLQNKLATTQCQLDEQVASRLESERRAQMYQAEAKEKSLELFALEQELVKIRELKRPALPSTAYGPSATDLTAKLAAVQNRAASNSSGRPTTPTRETVIKLENTVTEQQMTIKELRDEVAKLKSTAGPQVLRAATVREARHLDDDLLSKGSREEIVKLNTIIQSQKDTIAELRNDMDRWQKLLQQHRQVIRDLQQDASLPSMPSPYASPFPSPSKRPTSPKPELTKLSSQLDAMRFREDSLPRTSSSNSSLAASETSPSATRRAQYSALSVDPPSPSRSIRRKTIDRDLAKLQTAKSVERNKSVLMTPRKAQEKQQRVLSGLSNRALDKQFFQ